MIEDAGLVPNENNLQQLAQAIAVISGKNIVELSEYVTDNRKIITTAPLKGVGSLSQDSTLSVDAATTAAKGILAWPPMPWLRPEPTRQRL